MIRKLFCSFFVAFCLCSSLAVAEPAGSKKEQTIDEMMTELAGKDWREKAKEFDKKNRPRLQELDKKYSITKYPYPPTSPKEVSQSIDITQHILKSDYKKAEQLHLKQISEFPGSPSAAIEFVYFLIERNRLEEARAQLSQSSAKFPDHPEIKILEEGIGSIEKATSPEEKKLAKRELTLLKLDVEKIKLEFFKSRMKKKGS